MTIYHASRWEIALALFSRGAARLRLSLSGQSGGPLVVIVRSIERESDSGCVFRVQAQRWPYQGPGSSARGPEPVETFMVQTDFGP